MTGADLRDHRRAKGLTQTALADLAGCRRGAVAYWERKQVLDRKSALVRRLGRIVGMYDYETCTRTRVHTRAGWGVTPDAAPVAPPEDATWSAKLADLEARIMARQVRRHETDLRQQAAWEARQEVRRQAERLVQHRAERDAQHALREQARCGALARKGTACRQAVEPGRTRCKFHGGMSTGPRTPEGRERIGEAQRRRWAVWRRAQAAQDDELLGR
jgi:transcriptional regulator with XRE-family HTH domain